MAQLVQEFDPGDLVTLKSGSPVMTVSRKEATSLGRFRYTCHWFVNEMVFTGEFYAAELRPFNEMVQPTQGQAGGNLRVQGVPQRD